MHTRGAMPKCQFPCFMCCFKETWAQVWLVKQVKQGVSLLRQGTLSLSQPLAWTNDHCVNQTINQMVSTFVKDLFEVLSVYFNNYQILIDDIKTTTE